MKKYTLLLLLVLGISTTAWGGFACVNVPACTPCEEDVQINVTACIPYDCDCPAEIRHCVRGNMVLVDIDYTCHGCTCGGKKEVNKNVVVPLCPGIYSVLVRINVDCDDDCWPFGPRVAAIGSAFFKVCCNDPCPSPWCPTPYPCAGCPDDNGG
jgi:hypothetical protein